MHFLIPYAASHAEGCLAVLPTLALPKLQKLLTRLTPQPLDGGDELSLSPPHERALAKALGLPVADGLIPWAALQARQQAVLPSSEGSWGFVTLCHWQMHTQHIILRELPLRNLSAAESDALLGAMQPFFAQDGMALIPDVPGRWLAHGLALAGLSTASADRAQGRNLKPWLPSGAQATTLLRLQSEMQMLLYTHPVNDAREARGVLPVNAFWLNGTGDLTAAPTPAQDGAKAPTVINTLRDAALQDDWPAWASAWQALDASHGAALLAAQARGEPVQLTLCGERNAQSWVNRPQSLRQRLGAFFAPQSLQRKLVQL